MDVDPTTAALLARVRACTRCVGVLPLGPRPVLQLHPSARLLVAAQAPGHKVHASGVPFDDASGERLRDWLGLDRATFHDARRVAIVPMGLCYPGRAAGGDRPPRPECAPLWRAPLLACLSGLRLTLVIGRHALAWHLPHARSLTQAVQECDVARAAVVPLPHPSPRNNLWLARHRWFERERLALLRARVCDALRP